MPGNLHFRKNVHCLEIGNPFNEIELQNAYIKDFLNKLLEVVKENKANLPSFEFRCTYNEDMGIKCRITTDSAIQDYNVESIRPAPMPRNYFSFDFEKNDT